MINILDSSKMGNGTKMFETPYDLYIDNIEYDKENMLHTPFRCFNDLNTVNNIVFNKTLSPYNNVRWYNGLKVNNVLVDNKDKNIIYTSHYENNDKGESNLNTWNASDFRVKISKINRNEKVNISNYYDSSNYYNFNNNLVKFLGQNDTYIYISVVSSYEYNYNSYSYHKPCDYYYNQRSDNYGSLQSKIIAIDKQKLSKSSTNNYTRIVTLYRSYGNVKVIKETEEEIFCIAGIYDSSYNQYQIFKITKSNNSYSNITNFHQDYDYNQRSDIVTPSDIIKIDEDNYVFYINLMEKGEQVPEQNYYYRKNFLYKCKFTISTSELKKTKITVNEDELPYFGVHVGKFYNEIYHFENNGSNYLVTSTNTFYLNDSHKPDDKIISYYKLESKVEDDTISMKLLDTIVAKNISGDFYGMLFNEKEHTFLAMTNTTSYLFDFSAEKIKIIDLKNKPKEIGIDLEGNYYGSNDDTSVYIYGKQKVSNIVLTAPDIPEKVSYPYKTNIKLSAFNYEGTRIEIPIRNIIVGDNVTFDENSSNILIKNSSDSQEVEIPITITNDSIFEVYAQVERDDIL